MKMLTTQLAGVLQRIAGSQEEAIEDTARLLAQAAAGEGRVLVYGFREMHGAVLNVLEGAEPLVRAAELTEGTAPGTMDRVWLFARHAGEEEVIRLARSLSENGSSFAVVADQPASAENELSELADVYVATGITKGLLPNDAGERVVLPYLFAALFVAEAVKLSYDEILMDL